MSWITAALLHCTWTASPPPLQIQTMLQSRNIPVPEQWASPGRGDVYCCLRHGWKSSTAVGSIPGFAIGLIVHLRLLPLHSG
ncbi:UNVERIFIED_CONTAM: hypothetical protein FKN15_068071 [Acipenser sinensis]